MSGWLDVFVLIVLFLALWAIGNGLIDEWLAHRDARRRNQARPYKRKIR